MEIWQEGLAFPFTAAAYALRNNPRLLIPKLQLMSRRTRSFRAPRVKNVSFKASNYFNRLAKLQEHSRLAREVMRRKHRAKYFRNMNTRTAGFLGVEHKFYDTSLASGAIGAPVDCSGGEFDPSATSMISTPSQGDGEQTRDGKKMVIESCHINGIVYRGSTEGVADPNNPCHVFVALVLDTQTNGAQLNSEDVFKNPLAQVTTAASPFKNLLHGPRFKVLKSARFDMNYRTLASPVANSHASNGEARPFQWNVKFPKGLHVNFNSGTTASVANVIDNSLHMIAFSTNGGAACTLNYNARIRFQG